MENENHPLWPAFVVWARSRRISLADPDSWIDHWICFIAGAHAATIVKAGYRP